VLSHTDVVFPGGDSVWFGAYDRETLALIVEGLGLELSDVELLVKIGFITIRDGNRVPLTVGV
jgi:hypothetical protein